MWCPFDEEWSAYYNTFRENGYNVVRSSLKEGQNFFNYEPPEDYDVIISNPPFSIKDKVLKRLYELGKPFAVLLPVTALQAKARVRLYRRYGLELLVFDGRIDYHTNGDFQRSKSGIHYGSAYFCKGVLPEPLVFRELKKFDRPLKPLQ